MQLYVQWDSIPTHGFDLKYIELLNWLFDLHVDLDALLTIFWLFVSLVFCFLVFLFLVFNCKFWKSSPEQQKLFNAGHSLFNFWPKKAHTENIEWQRLCTTTTTLTLGYISSQFFRRSIASSSHCSVFPRSELFLPVFPPRMRHIAHTPCSPPFRSRNCYAFYSWDSCCGWAPHRDSSCLGSVAALGTLHSLRLGS